MPGREKNYKRILQKIFQWVAFRGDVRAEGGNVGSITVTGDNATRVEWDHLGGRIKVQTDFRLKNNKCP